MPLLVQPTYFRIVSQAENVYEKYILAEGHHLVLFFGSQQNHS